ncbi:sensor histidine kinase [Streptomyces sp. ISL-98]|uniref:sensor histidine kinase n=1 Tax=Streptomyces sp. ISL-98 TaxID=2819192 RepID=UPI001BE7AFD5|nr:sensor histidine kinase [Streptomyces sp. ISL-98]MBT2508991.1 sensor histidine kinase [Streptomyces sp. ISL-98]
MRGDQRDRHAWRTGLIDKGLAAVIGGAVLLAGFTTSGPGPGTADVVLVMAGSLALAVHRRAPVPVLVFTAACMLGYVVHANPGTSAAFPVVAGVHAVTRAGHRAAAVGVSVVFLVGFFFASTSGDGFERTLLLHGWFICAGVTGLIDKNWQAYLRQTEERAAEAERTREEAALRRAGEERLRIARELHDSLTHSISIVKLQAGVAVHLARKRGEEVPEALLAIQEASGEAMRELRATLDVLRTDVVPPGSGLDRLGELVERACAAGLAASVTVAGEERQLPTDVDRAAYRIVQEALTNVARHAGRAKTSVQLTYAGDHFAVRIDDEGTDATAGPTTPGTGLTGMRERVAALGGVLHAAPRPDGGFTVRAELPLDAS